MKANQESWTCNDCGRKNPPGALYCGGCGAKKENQVAPPPVKTQPQPSNYPTDKTRISKPLIAVCVAAAFLVALAAFALLRHGGTNTGKTNALFDAFLKNHPEYAYAAQLDLDGDSVKEMLVSEYDHDMRSWLCVVSQDGKRINFWGLSSRYGDFRYDADTNRLAVHTSGTGMAEYCFIKLNGDELEVWHVGRNSDTLSGYFYAFTERVPGGGERYVSYSYGEFKGQPGRLDMDFLSKNAISQAEYDKWERKYDGLPLIERKPF